MDASARYIRPFDKNHLLYIAILLFFILLLFFFRKDLKKIWKQTDRVILTISILQQILLYGAYFTVEGFSWGEALPLHISRINSLLGIALLFTGNRNIFRVLTHFSVFALLSFLLPVDIDPITHPFGLSFLINHVITLLLPAYIMITRNLRVKYPDILYSFRWFIIYLTSVLIINPLTGGNYFYLKEKPVLKTLPDIYYIPITLLAVFILFFIWNYLYRTIWGEDETVSY